MQKILFSVIFSFVLSLATGQDIHTIKQFADQQYKLKNFDIALKEYQRVHYFDSLHRYKDIAQKIARVFYLKQNYDKAIQFYNYAWHIEKNDSLKSELVFEKVLCYLKTKNFYGAINELYDFTPPRSKYFQSKKTFYEAVCQFGVSDFDTAEKLFGQLVNQKGKDSLRIVFNKFKEFTKKYDPKRIERMSRLLPGLGQFYTGHWKSGLNSVVLLSAVVLYAGITMVNYTFLDGMLVLSSWFIRYYSGGAEKARDIAIEENLKQQAVVYTQIIQIIEKYGNYK